MVAKYWSPPSAPFELLPWDFRLRKTLVLASLTVSLAVGMAPPPTVAETAADAAEAPQFGGEVRRILKTHCFHCHGEAGVTEAGLDLRLRRLILRGGDSGPAISTESPDESLLLERMVAGEMPPEDIKHRPSLAEIATLRRWLRAGAPGAEEPEDVDPSEYITPAERAFWAFQQPSRAPLPSVAHDGEAAPRGAIDLFLTRKLDERGLHFAKPADRQMLIRRIYFDLWGLPPTPEEVDSFVNDSHPLAYERLVDRLLASPRYGERWGRHWLDVAGYADSEGYGDEDSERPDAWRYRDYVIRAFNHNKPIDQFFVEQLAGDELVRPPYGELPVDELDKLVATGFLRMAPDGTATAADKPVAINETVAKSLEIVSSSMLGLTVACAQCHDHRYDPISQRDYYRFRAIFEPAYRWQTWKTPRQRRQSLYTDAHRAEAAQIEAAAKKIEAARVEKQQEFIQATYEEQLAKLPDDVRETVRLAHDTPEKDRSAEQTALLKKYPSVNVTAGSLYLYDRKAADELKAMAEEAAKIRKTKPVEQFVRALIEPEAGEVPVSHVFIRGDHEQPGDQVQPSGLRVLGASPLPANVAEPPSTNRRLQFARWLTSDRHPLTARVFVNRVWMHHFGRGLVETPTDFGQLGARPTHPELLDWLAADFVEHGWDLKRLHRMLVLSTAYRQSSREIDAPPAGREQDPELYLLWKMPLRRVEAEVLRDAMLQITGQINYEASGPSVPVMADRDGKFVIGIENLNAGRPGAVIPMKGQDLRRSVYVQVRRSRPLTVLDTFDSPIMSPNCAKRTYSTSATQALMLMNGGFTLSQAEQLAKRIRGEASESLEAQVELAWKLCYSRAPRPDEVRDGVDWVRVTEDHWLQQNEKTEAAKSDEAKVEARQFALSDLCHALISGNEFLYIE